MTQLKLESGHWYGLVECPAVGEGMGASPILIKQVEPLKTGKGVLRLDFLQPIHPKTGERRKVALKVLERGPDRITAVVDDHPRRQGCILCPLNESWLNDWCGDLRKRRPTWSMALLINDKQFGGAELEDVVGQLFGERDEEILNGALLNSHRTEQTGTPARSVTAPFSLELQPFESWLAARGYVPQAMEQKWFIHRSGDDRMHFRRSWTGHLVYDVAISWCGPRMTLGDVIISRDADHWGVTDVEYDLRLLRFLIDGILLGLPVDFPLETETDNPLQAWVLAGSQAGVT